MLKDERTQEEKIQLAVSFISSGLQMLSLAGYEIPEKINFEKKKNDKSFDASTHICEDCKNFKIRHEALGVFMDEFHEKFYTT